MAGAQAKARRVLETSKEPLPQPQGLSAERGRPEATLPHHPLPALGAGVQPSRVRSSALAHPGDSANL